MKNQFLAIHDLLFRLGIVPGYAGYDLAAYAVLLCIEQPKRLRLIMKRLYPDVAKMCGTTSWAVERNIRTVSRIAWQRNRALLETLAKRPLERPPQNIQFLSFLCAGISPLFTLPPHGLDEAVTFTREDYEMGMVDEAADGGGGKVGHP